MRIETLTIQQYMEITLISETYKDDMNKYQKKIIEYFDGSLDIPIEQSDETILSLEQVLMTQPSFVHRFEIDGIEFGFIPNLENMTTGEYIDLDEYLKDGKKLDRIMSILYRPVTKSKGELYQIEEYEGTDKYSESMKKVDFKIIKSAQVFFSNIEKSLLNASNIFIIKNKKKLKKIEKIYQKTTQKKPNSMKDSAGIQ